MENSELRTMRILVPVKRVIDPYVKIRIKQDGTGVETHQVKMVMNPFDEIALEEALRLKEQGHAKDIICLSIGDKTCQETLRHGLAMGADRAILIENDSELDSLNIAKILADVSQKEKPDLILMGKQSIDNDANQTPQMLAGILDWPQATYVSQIKLSGQSLEVLRETDQGLEQLKTSVPAVVSVDLRLNEPRYATLPNIMKARTKPLAIMSLSDLNITPRSSITKNEYMKPPVRAKGVMLADVNELLEKIKPLLTS
jgi:electron transfer flavoprotein beta subunit